MHKAKNREEQNILTDRYARAWMAQGGGINCKEGTKKSAEVHGGSV